ncbi:hypothetical protein PV721_40160 [Streptomyces sp. MB09-01]|uniref:hypothetical protein n=1 Tax=Streptomyces sp. MB09-01 TaxID=3028666 RepID=UPI0029B148AA|nr:hypothetical protein [Streptomyces sp. MB09-01]MDX3540411.1 hypothetical protein [Streptomyces sp. MB09-01]
MPRSRGPGRPDRATRRCARLRGSLRALALLALLAPAVLGAAPAGSGETISLAGNEPGQRLDVTLTQVVDPASPADPGPSPEPAPVPRPQPDPELAPPSPPSGSDRLVAVRFQLENTGATVYRDSPAAAAHLLDNTGQRFTGLNVPTTAGASFPDTVTLDPGGATEGFVTFRLPEDAGLAAVQFALNGGLADDVGQWSLPQDSRQGSGQEPGRDLRP